MPSSGTKRAAAPSMALVVALLAVGLVGCAGLPGAFGLASGQEGRLTEDELLDELIDFTSHFASVVSGTADRISDATRDARVRKRALLWKIRVVPAQQDIAFDQDPQEAYISNLLLTIMMRHYFSDGDGRELFAAEQPVAVEAAEILESSALDIGRGFLDVSELEALRQELERLARRRPIVGNDFGVQNQHVFRAAQAEVRLSPVLSSVLSAPMAPFRALEGVSSGAAAIHEFNQTASVFASIVRGIPEQMRWEAELLLYDVEERESTVRLLLALEGVAESAAVAAARFDDLPDDLKRVLEESRGTLRDAKSLIEQATALVGPLGEAAEHVRLAGEGWAGLFERDGDRPQEGRPFDITEWESAAHQLAATASELRSLAEEVRGLTAEGSAGGLAAGAEATLDAAEARARSLIHTAGVWLAGLMAGFFALLFVYRVAAARLGPGPQAD